MEPQIISPISYPDTAAQEKQEMAMAGKFLLRRKEGARDQALLLAMSTGAVDLLTLPSQLSCSLFTVRR